MKRNLVGVILLLALASCGPEEQTAAPKGSRNSPQEQAPESGPVGTKRPDQPSHEFSVENGASVKSTPKTSCAKVMALKSPGSLKSLSNLKSRFLNAHNEVRKIYNLAPLAWDQNLANYAQAWANELKSKHKCNLYHRQNLGRTEGKSYGENLAWFWTTQKLAPSAFSSSPNAATYSWAQECRDYSYSSNSCASGKQCGHLTQVIWQKTKKVGCGVAVCQDSGSRSEVWVCNYDPPGNMTINGIKQRPY